MNQKIADSINTLAQFCGKRDVDSLTQQSLFEKYKIIKADVMVLFGGSIIKGGDVLAEAIKENVARKYVIVGGAGHTTETLRRRIHKEYPSIVTDGLPEAEVFNKYLSAVYGLKADLLETASTNCGNNITNLLLLLKSNHTDCKSIILCQDATMQYRMEAVLRKFAPDDLLIIDYASYKAEVDVRENKLVYTKEIHGMWDIERYINLLMGEIPRLCDNAEGYGPNGKNFLAHVDVPDEVIEAFNYLKKEYGASVREANPLYKSK